MKASNSRTDISCCIILEAEEYRKRELFSFRPDVIAAASELMSHTLLTDVRTCVTDGQHWMFGRLMKRDGRRVYMDLDPLTIYPVPLHRPPD
ncbi:hypothetical protein C8T65DRAFT_665651, partial [Cerioporus squamosus]